jgi:integrase
MKADVTRSNSGVEIQSPQAASKRTPRSPYQYKKVLDGRKQPIRGLWQRNGKFIGRISTEGEDGVKRVKWVSLEKAETIPQAQDALKTLHVDREHDTLPVLSRTPKFGDYADSYLAFIKSGQGTKKLGTISKEESTLKLWKDHFGGTRLDKIKPAHISAFMQKRLNAKMSKRTGKLDVIALRNVLKRARDIDAYIRVLPIPNGLNQELKRAAKKRELFTGDDLEKLCQSALAVNEDKTPVTKNGQQFADYVRLMAYSGARRNEALELRWQDVDFERDQLTIGASGDTKNQTHRTVNFNSKWKAHLNAMHQRRAPDSQWLFPSPQRGEKDIHAMSFRESLELVRTHAKMPKIAFHDMRHCFISYAVMSGVDFMTIASWVGHRDGGVLIGKVYGHLADSHRTAQALRVNFGPVDVEPGSKAVAYSPAYERKLSLARPR